jgi:hypothetical protein
MTDLEECRDFTLEETLPPLIEEVKVGSGINESKRTTLVQSAVLNTDSRISSDYII